MGVGEGEDCLTTTVGTARTWSKRRGRRSSNPGGKENHREVTGRPGRPAGQGGRGVKFGDREELLTALFYTERGRNGTWSRGGGGDGVCV